MTKKMKKAALELSSSFLVGIILGILLLGLGIGFAMNLFNAAVKIIDNGVDMGYFDSIAEQCVQRGDKLCVPELVKEIPVGMSKSFGIVINNVDGSERKFRPNVRFSIGTLEDGKEITTTTKKWTYENKDFREITLEDKETYTLSVPIQVPGGTKPGTYVFNVNICYDSDLYEEPVKCPDSRYPSLYGKTQQISITVP
jgi:hypothetical protein